MTVAQFTRSASEVQSEGYRYNFALGLQQGAAAERARCAAILRSPEASVRRELAVHLATATSMSAEDAIEVLRAAPKTTASEPRPGQAFYEGIAAGTKADVKDESGLKSRFVQESTERFRNR